MGNGCVRIHRLVSSQFKYKLFSILFSGWRLDSDFTYPQSGVDHLGSLSVLASTMTYLTDKQQGLI